MKLSKGAKARIKMMTNQQRSSLAKAAKLMADSECITMKRASEILKWCHKGGW